MLRQSCTGNFRAWRHFLKLRLSPKAHPQMREIAELLAQQLVRISPTCFVDIVTKDRL